MANDRISMQEIAEDIGVSRMTVSRALRNDPKISERTKERVRRACAKAGYQPDPRLSELMSHLRRTKGRRSTETIAYLHLLPEEPMGDSLLNERRIFDGCCSRAGELGFQIDEFPWVPSNLSVKRLVGILRSRGIRGAVLRITGSVPKGMGELYSEIAIATSDETLTVFNHAIPDHFQGMSEVLEKLRKMGYRRIGFYHLDSVKDWAADQWKASFSYRLSKLDAFHKGSIKTDPLPRPKPLMRWIRSYRPDAIISHLPAAKVLELVRIEGIKVPKELGIATVSWHPNFPEVAGVDQNSEQVGAATIDLIARQLTYNESGIPPFPKKMLIPSTWKPGSSIRRV